MSPCGRREFIAAAALASGRLRWRGWSPLLLAAARPVPTPQQLRWQREELALFLHFGVNTFTDREWGDGSESPTIFAPGAVDAGRWARVARASGFGTVILTAKHHDGFCLWPSALTRHSVAASPWQGGHGDVVRDLAHACRAERLGLGLYLSPWDRHEPTYGDSARYMDFYCGQLEELLTGYGPVREVWFDGANGEGPNGRRQVYDWNRIHATVRRLQPGAVIFSDAGPDVRWIGNERGVAGETCWSTIDPGSVPYAGYDGPHVGDLLQTGDPNGSVWRPGETDVSIRPGWFWHEGETDRVRSGDQLLDLYFSSVGRNSKLLLNVPPTRDGVLHPTDVSALHAFRGRRQDIFASDLALGARVGTAGGNEGRAVSDGDPTTLWSAPGNATEVTLDIALRRTSRCNVLRLEEPIEHGQSVERFQLLAKVGDGWQQVAAGTTIGACRLARFPFVNSQRLRLTLSSTLDTIRLSRFSLFADPAA